MPHEWDSTERPDLCRSQSDHRNDLLAHNLADIAVLRDGGDVTVGNQTPRLALAGTEPRYNSVRAASPYMTSAIMLVCGLVTRLAPSGHASAWHS